jgi:hypothetical protein
MRESRSPYKDTTPRLAMSGVHSALDNTPALGNSLFHVETLIYGDYIVLMTDPQGLSICAAPPFILPSLHVANIVTLYTFG